MAAGRGGRGRNDEGFGHMRQMLPCAAILGLMLAGSASGFLAPSAVTLGGRTLCSWRLENRCFYQFTVPRQDSLKVVFVGVSK